MKDKVLYIAECVENDANDLTEAVDMLECVHNSIMKKHGDTPESRTFEYALGLLTSALAAVDEEANQLRELAGA